MLGDVMNESARIAVSYVLGHFEELGIAEPVAKEKGIHLHVPAGAVRKDGPSAGVTMVTALVSLLTRRGVGPAGATTRQITPAGGDHPGRRGRGGRGDPRQGSRRKTGGNPGSPPAERQSEGRRRDPAAAPARHEVRFRREVSRASRARVPERAARSRQRGAQGA